MFEQITYLKNQYAQFHPHLELVAIEEVAIPAAELKIAILGQEILEIPPSTLYLLQFTNLGISKLTELSQALGLGLMLVHEIVTESLSRGYLKPGLDKDSVTLTPYGKEVLTNAFAKVPKKVEISVLFDKSSWKLTNWKKHVLLDRKTIKERSENGYFLPAKKRKTIRLGDVSLIDINQIVLKLQDLNHKIEVLDILKVKLKQNSFRFGSLLLFSSASGESDFAITVDGERDLEAETILKEKGGLEFLGIKFTHPDTSEIKSVEVAIENHVGIDPNEFAKFCRQLASFEHSKVLSAAFDEVERRLLIIAPWIGGDVVNDFFIKRLERALKRSIQITIGWGLYDKKYPRYTNLSVLNQLYDLSTRYANFNFRYFGNTHAKILVADDAVVVGSHNWLSFSGDSKREYRREYSMLLSIPQVADQFYEYHLKDMFDDAIAMNPGIIEEIRGYNLDFDKRRSK